MNDDIVAFIVAGGTGAAPLARKHGMTESNRVVYAAVAANLLIAVAKFAAAFATGSSAMLTEGIHSLVDSGNGGLLLLGARLARKPADGRHPHGHGREVYFWSFVVAVMIFAVGGGISIYEGILRLLHPEPIKSAIWNYVVLGASFLFEGTSFLIALRHFRKQTTQNLSLLAAIRRSKDPADFMVLLEDSAALVGIVVAALGVTLQLVTGNGAFDGGASILIGILLCVVASILAVETRGLLVGEGMLPESASKIRRVIEDDPAVERAAYPLSSYLGPDTVLINVAIQFDPTLTTPAIEEAVARIQEKVRAQYPVVKRVYVVPETIE